MTALGHAVLRFTGDQVLHQRAWWPARVADVLSNGPLRPMGPRART